MAVHVYLFYLMLSFFVLSLLIIDTSERAARQRTAPPLPVPGSGQMTEICT